MGGGTKRGMVWGRPGGHAANILDRPVSSGDLVATIYQLLEIDPYMTVDDLNGRPIGTSHVWEIMA